ncbi:glycosyltransferase family 2 protein [Oceanicola granulosus]|nr:glycosyltransferase family 2 protein [Oceanicola granulosus]
MLPLMILCLALEAGLALLQFATMLRLPSAPPAGRPGHEPFFSVHVATHNEPPEVVCETLRALAAQDWPRERHEIIVMDNNTADPALWRPVEACCAELGATFLHREGVKGAKAGALDIALAAADARATHVVTVDCDYVVAPDFLSRTAAELEAGDDWLQFPQAYRGAPATAGFELELGDYFATYARAANRSGAALPTGTLTVVAIPALAAVGGWRAMSVTEDAELGLKLCRQGFAGRFVPASVGRGALPLDLASCESQRHRWSYGNARVLGQFARRRFGGLRGWHVLAQLSAWQSAALLPAGVLVGALLAGERGAVVTLAALCLLAGLLRAGLRLALVGRRERAGTVLAALVARLALLPAAARGTVDALGSGRLPFAVTPKAARAAATLPLDHLALFAAGLLALPNALAAGPWAIAGLACLMSLLPAALLLSRALSACQPH